MLAAEGILTARGGLVSHAAVVARGWGKPAVVGAESVSIGDSSFSVGTTVVHQGDWISVDGTTGKVMLGQIPVSRGETPPEFGTILSWADAIRCGPTPTTDPTPPTPVTTAPRASDCAAPSTCSWPTTGYPSCVG
jgi:pyruvate,orthophosphate dikinase